MAKATTKSNTPDTPSLAVLAAELRETKNTIDKLADMLRPAPDPEPDGGETEKSVDTLSELETVQCHLECLAGLCWQIGDGYHDATVSKTFPRHRQRDRRGVRAGRRCG